jgi:hypothetical protein
MNGLNSYVFEPSNYQIGASVAIACAYVGCVIGGVRSMHHRAPVDVNRFAVVHSALLSVASFIMFAGLVYGAVTRAMERGLYALFCDTRPLQRGPLAFFTWIYWCASCVILPCL